MSTRQYIGARYTPKFSGTYDATQAYEALEVVDNGSGTTYIAKKPVPPNIPLTNTEYWLVYGSSSGAILDLQNRVSAIENDIPAISQDITNIKGSILTMGSQIGSLEGNVDDIETDIENIKAQVSGQDMRLVVISDSYGEVRGGVTPFTQRLAACLGLSGSNYYYFAEGGMGITPNISTTAQSLLESHSGDIADHNTITHILFALGANDIANRAQLSTYMPSLITYCRSAYPNAQIIFAMIGNDWRLTVAQKNATINLYRSISTSMGCKYIEGSHYIACYKDLLQSDKVHPTNDGSNALAQKLAEGLINGEIHFKHSTSATFSLFNGNLALILYFVGYDDNISIRGSGSSGGSYTIPATWTEINTSSVTAGSVPIKGSGTMNEIGYVAGANPLDVTINGDILYIRPASLSAVSVVSGQRVMISNVTGCLSEES